MSADANLPLYPEPLSAEGRLKGLSFSASLIEQAPHACPAYISLRATRGVYAGTGRWRQTGRPPVDFFQGTLFDALSNAEDGMDVDQSIDNSVIEARDVGEPIHPHVVAYMREAAKQYLAFSLERADKLSLQPAEARTLQSRRKPPRELKAWGRWYENDDSSYREFRRLRYSSAKESTDDRMRFAAAAAKLLVDGEIEDVTGPKSVPERVVVIEVGMLDGSTTELFDGTPDEARALYNERCYPFTKDLHEDVIELKPGRECSQCSWRVVCPAVQQLRGVLGLPGRAASTRDISASDLVQYSICPASYAARVGHLPATADVPTSHAAERGRAVHRWLKAAHVRGVACSADDLPADGPDPLGVLDDVDYEDALPYLSSHIPNCPFTATTTLDVEPTFRVWDADADVMVVAAPDVRWNLPDGTPVWRETKTVPKLVPHDAHALLRKWPQVALYLVMLAEGAGGGERKPETYVGAVEVEMLTDTGSRPVVTFETTDEVIVALARRVVAEAAYAWSQDIEFKTKPGAYCANCSALRWCDAAETAAPTVSTEVDVDDDSLFIATDDIFEI